MKVKSTATHRVAERELIMKKFYYVLVLAMVVSACENTNNVNNTNNTNLHEICNDNIDNDLDGQIDCNDSDCANNSACVTAPNCGNGLVDADEECDGTDLNGASCESLQLGTGTVTCIDCALDTRGCGNNNALKIYQSGTRMKMRVGTSLDGAKEFKGWYDSQLGINCVFRKMTSGLTRCIPELTSLNDRWYSDANCTVRAAVLPEEDDNLSQLTFISMEVRSGVYEVKQVVARMVMSVYRKELTGSCTYAAAGPAGFDIYQLASSDDTQYQAQAETVE